ncbi:MAG: hypothetical protein PHF12_00225 [Candidatus Omnitrophica bacterium]|nr:hypothetical protein [Candidatus Omnitrophota bacterium]
MDIYCKRCGEPWDAYGVRHGDLTDEERERFFKGGGCPHCYGKPVERRPFRAQLAEALGDVLGDDIDGLAAEMEDAEYLLGDKFWE